MKWLNVITLALTIIGGLNWGLVSLGGHGMDFVASLFGGDQAIGARSIYAVLALAALWQVMPWVKALKISEAEAEAAHTARPIH